MPTQAPIRATNASLSNSTRYTRVNPPKNMGNNPINRQPIRKK